MPTVCALKSLIMLLPGDENGTDSSSDLTQRQTDIKIKNQNDSVCKHATNQNKQKCVFHKAYS